MTHRWIATWAAAPMNVWSADTVLPGFFNQTVREIARVSVGGTRVRIRLSNEFGSIPLAIDSASIALAGEAGAIQPLTSRILTFGGDTSAFVLPGCPLLSDPIDLDLPSLSHLAVSLYFKNHTPVQTHHYEAQQTAYISIPGNFAGAERMPVEQTTTSRYMLSGVFVEAADEARSIVCLGDSITDGYGSRIDGDNRWPDILAQRLQARPGCENIAVLNQGIGGNRILASQRGSKALERFDRDVLSLPAVSHLLVLEGINDIGWPNTVLAGADEAVSARQIVAGLIQMVERAHVAGIKVILSTILPFEGAMSGAPLQTYYTPEKEKLRLAVNQWIRGNDHADAVVDLDAVVRDHVHQKRLNPAFDCGDHLHLNDAGYRAIAESLDLDLFA